MRKAASSQHTESQLLFLPGVFNETLSLLFDAHHYFQSRGAEEQATIAPTHRVFYSAEMSRVTMRLTSVMAWIMVRRAVYAGNIDEAKANTDYRLDGKEVYQVDNKEMLADMPYYLNYLSERSVSLYERVLRLDALAYDEPKH
jgi:regulator of CtrA degradation